MGGHEVALEPRGVRLGMLTPSSNTRLEEACFRMVDPLPDVSVHFSRFRVTEISLTDKGVGQFQDEVMLQAAELLADAHVDSIVWNGTSGAWMGFDADERLCAAITERTGVPATTSVLALNLALRRLGATRLGFVTPYTTDVQEKILAVYRAASWECTERHLGISVNDEFSRIPVDLIESMVRELALENPEAITTFCTNLRSAGSSAALEAQLGIPVLDSTSLAVWAGLGLAGHPTSDVVGWGSLFELPYGEPAVAS